MKLYKCKHNDHGVCMVNCRQFPSSDTIMIIVVVDAIDRILSQKKITRDHFEQIRYDHELLLTLMGWEIVE